MARRSGGRSSVHKHSWRQKGIAAAAALAILTPVVDGYVEENMPEGLPSYVRSLQIEPFTERDASPVEEPVPGLEIDRSFTYTTRDVEIEPSVAYRLASGLTSLERSIGAIRSVSNDAHVSEHLLLTLATLESKGGQVPIPHEYPQVEQAEVPASTPAGFYHAKLESLEEAVNGAAAARTRLSELGSASVRGWPTPEEARSSIPAAAYDAFVEAYGSGELADRALQLAAQVPEGPISDRFDPAQSTRGAIAYVALIDAHLQAAGVETPSLAQILAGYTGGHNGVRRAADADDDSVGRAVANDRGERYTRAGEQMHAILEAYGRPEDAIEAAHSLFAFSEEHPDATIEILGTLYAGAAQNPNTFRNFGSYVEARRDEERKYRWVPMAELWDGYSENTTLAER